MMFMINDRETAAARKMQKALTKWVAARRDLDTQKARRATAGAAEVRPFSRRRQPFRNGGGKYPPGRVRPRSAAGGGPSGRSVFAPPCPNSYNPPCPPQGEPAAPCAPLR